MVQRSQRRKQSHGTSAIDQSSKEGPGFVLILDLSSQLGVVVLVQELPELRPGRATELDEVLTSGQTARPALLQPELGNACRDPVDVGHHPGAVAGRTPTLIGPGHGGQQVVDESVAHALALDAGAVVTACVLRSGRTLGRRRCRSLALLGTLAPPDSATLVFDADGHPDGYGVIQVRGKGLGKSDAAM